MCLGLQAKECIHTSPEPYGMHCQGFLEDGSRQEVWSDYHAMWLGGKWTGISQSTGVLYYRDGHGLGSMPIHLAHHCFRIPW